MLRDYFRLLLGGKQCGYSPPAGVLTTRGQFMTLYFQKDSTYIYFDFDMILTSYHTGKKQHISLIEIFKILNSEQN